MAEQAPPEPYVPGSGERIPAELRLVLAGYVGVACGLIAGVLACAAAAVLAPLAAGAGTEILQDSLTRFAHPDGAAWSDIEQPSR